MKRRQITCGCGKVLKYEENNDDEADLELVCDNCGEIQIFLGGVI